VALEPYVRRHWPHALIGWTRLLTGRWRDRQVGGDLLIGALVGLAGVIIDRAAAAIAAWHLGTIVIWRVDLDTLGSSGTVAATFLRAVATASVYPIGLLFLLLLLRLMAPRTWLAPVLAVAVVVGLASPSFIDPLIEVPLACLSAGLPVFLLIRYGLLASATSMLVDDLASHVVVSLDLSPFFGRTMLAGVLLMTLPALLGYYFSMTGHSLVGRRFDLGDAVRDGEAR